MTAFPAARQCPGHSYDNLPGRKLALLLPVQAQQQRSALLLLRPTVCPLMQDEMIGSYTFSSAKAARLHSADQGRCVAHMFAMRVAEELPVWPEAGQRRRVWVSQGAAQAAVQVATPNAVR